MTSLLKKVGRQGANRLKKEFLDEANDKATNLVFEKIQFLMQNYVVCKDKGRVCAILFFGKFHLFSLISLHDANLKFKTVRIKNNIIIQGSTVLYTTSNKCTCFVFCSKFHVISWFK